MMVEAVETMDGWYCLHDLRTINWLKWKKATEKEREEAISEFEQLLSAWEDREDEKLGSHGVYQMLGHKADMMFMLLRPSMEELASLEKAIDISKLGEFLKRSYSYVSIVELAKYRPQQEGIDPETLPEVQKRLKPILPKWNHICFYPMSRKREEKNNWFTLEKKDRSKLLYEHSMTGRKYKGKVQQIITGSIGLDRFEWGVTLFAHEALQFKKIVYEMRFDEVTAKYGEFDDFYVGNYLGKESLRSYLMVHD